MTPTLTLVAGTEDLLADRAVAHVVAQVRAEDADLEVHTVEPGASAPGELTAMASPSLFGGTRVIVVRKAHELGTDLSGELVALIGSGSDLEGVHLVIAHSGAANRGKAVLEAARKAGAHEVPVAPLKKFGDRLAFVTNEFRHGRRRIDDPAARALLESIGDDVRELASAASQLMSDTEGDIDLAAVRRYYAGRADVTSFAVADRTVEGRTGEAVELLRHALASGVAPVLVTSALATQLRALVLVASAPRGLSPATSPDTRASRRGRSTWSVVSCAGGTATGSPRRSASSPGPTPRSRAPAATPSTPSRRPSSPSRPHAPADLYARPRARPRERRRRRTPRGSAPSNAGVRQKAQQPAWPSRTSCSRPGCCG